MSENEHQFADCLALETERLRLRPLAENDEALYSRIYSDAEILRHVCAPLLPEQARRSFTAALRHTRARAPREVFVVLTCRAGTENFGICGLRAIDIRRRRAEVGILLSAHARGRGIATEALRALLSRAFEAFLLEEICVEYSQQNNAMVRVAQRVGFESAIADGAICRGVRRWVMPATA